MLRSLGQLSRRCLLYTNRVNLSTWKLSDDEWKKKLSREQYRILRQKDTEYPGTGVYDKHFERGTYQCAGCGNDLYE